MRLAVIADIHGNSWALDAVLADAARRKPDGYVVLGDLVADGPDPVGALDRLRDLTPAWFVQGNTDRYVSRLDRLGPPRSELPDLVATWRWGANQLGDEGLRFLDETPNTVWIETPVGKLLATHGIPGDDETGVSPNFPNAIGTLRESGAALVLVGHTHHPFTWYHEGMLVVNPGSVGLSSRTDWLASYALIDLKPAYGVSVEHRQVAWDMPAFIRAFEAGMPANRKAMPMLNELKRRISHPAWAGP